MNNVVESLGIVLEELNISNPIPSPTAGTPKNVSFLVSEQEACHIGSSLLSSLNNHIDDDDGASKIMKWKNVYSQMCSKYPHLSFLCLDHDDKDNDENNHNIVDALHIFAHYVLEIKLSQLPSTTATTTTTTSKETIQEWQSMMEKHYKLRIQHLYQSYQFLLDSTSSTNDSNWKKNQPKVFIPSNQRHQNGRRSTTIPSKHNQKYSQTLKNNHKNITKTNNVPKNTKDKEDSITNKEVSNAKHVIQNNKNNTNIDTTGQYHKVKQEQEMKQKKKPQKKKQSTIKNIKIQTPIIPNQNNLIVDKKEAKVKINDKITNTNSDKTSTSQNGNKMGKPIPTKRDRRNNRQYSKKKNPNIQSEQKASL